VGSDVTKRQCLVTTKKSLVKADESEIITSYEDIQVGQKATGFISKMDDKALYVTFCNRVYGKVTARSLASELGIQDHTEIYRVGDIVTSRVLKLKQRDTKRKSPFDAEEAELDGAEEEATTTTPRAYWEVTLSRNVQDTDGEEDMQVDDDKIDVRNPKQVRVQSGAILQLESENIHALIHCTMKEWAEKKVKPRKTKNAENNKEQRISKGHPFYGLKVGQTLSELTVVSVMRRKGSVYVQLTADRSMEEPDKTEATVAPTFVARRPQLKPGMITSGIVTEGVAAQNRGIYVQVSPMVKGFVPGLELSRDLTVLNDIAAQGLVGLRIECCGMDEKQWHANRAKQCPFASQNQQSWADRKSKQAKKPQLYFVSYSLRRGKHRHRQASSW
jgi:hypothetical protein